MLFEYYAQRLSDSYRTVKNYLFSTAYCLYNLINARWVYFGFLLNYQKKGDGLYSKRKQGTILAYEHRSVC